MKSCYAQTWLCMRMQINPAPVGNWEFTTGGGRQPDGVVYGEKFNNRHKAVCMLWFVGLPGAFGNVTLRCTLHAHFHMHTWNTTVCPQLVRYRLFVVHDVYDHIDRSIDPMGVCTVARTDRWTNRNWALRVFSIYCLDYYNGWPYWKG